MRWQVRAGARRPLRAAFVSILKTLMKNPEIGKLVVPIIPDEARTFGMESLFREYGIYASQGQRYKPVDSNVLLYYKEAKNGQILEEGITEAGSMASFIGRGHGLCNARRADDSVLHVTIRCSGSSAWAIWSGRSPICAAKGS